jgi:hypothetical protein
MPIYFHSKSRHDHLFPDFTKKPAYHGYSCDFPSFPRKNPDKDGGLGYIGANNIVAQKKALHKENIF